MPTEPWVYGALALVVVLQVAAIVLWSRRTRTSEPSTGDHRFDVDDLDERTSDGGPSAVQCGECGARNAAGYQYCRECASQLPGPGESAMSGVSDSSGVF